jgi:hypothetical protein
LTVFDADLGRLIAAKGTLLRLERFQAETLSAVGRAEREL